MLEPQLSFILKEPIENDKKSVIILAEHKIINKNILSQMAS